MRCNRIKDKLAEALDRKGINLSPELREHVNKCPECALFLRELSLLGEKLNEPVLAVRPGELDNLTFENIIASSQQLKDAGGVRKIAFRLKWFWIPVAAAAASLLIFVFSNFGGRTIPGYAINGENDIYDNVEIIDQIAADDSLESRLLSSLAGGDSYLDHADEELLRQADLDELINGLTTDELRALYHKIDNLKG